MPPENAESLSEIGAEVMEHLNEDPAPEAPAAAIDEGGGETPATPEPETPAAPDAPEISIPKHRFDEVSKKHQEVNQKLQESLTELDGYRSFGTPEQIRTAVAALQRLIDEKNNIPAQPAQELSPEDRAFKDMMERIYGPGFGQNKPDESVASLKQQLDDLSVFVNESKATKAEERKSLIKGATESIKALAKEKELSVDNADTMLDLEGSIANIINRTPELAQRFYKQRDLTVVKQVFDDYYNRFFSGIRRSAISSVVNGKRVTEKLPKPVIPGGTPHAPAVDKLKDVNSLNDKQLTAAVSEFMEDFK